MKNTMKQFALKARAAIGCVLTEERGDTNIIMIVVILAISLALAIVFKNSLTGLFNSIWGSVTSQATTF